MKKLTLSACSLVALLGSAVAQAELSASFDLANLYLFRGLDMSNGSPAVAGALDYQHSQGWYAGAWSTSGDDAAGTEVNYYVGYQGQFKELSYKLDYLNYYYPKSKDSGAEAVNLNDFAEVTLGLGYQNAALSFTAPTSDDFAGDYIYYLLSYSYQDFSVALGINDHDDSAASYSHLDLSYQFNPRVHFVISQVIDQGSGAAYPDATVFQVNFNLPIEL